MLTLKKYLALSALSLSFLNAAAEIPYYDSYPNKESGLKKKYEQMIISKAIKGVKIDFTSEGCQKDGFETVANAHDDEYYTPRHPQRSILCRFQAYLDLHESLSKLPENPDRKDLKDCCKNNTPLAQWPAYLRKKLLNMGALDDLGACDAQGNLAYTLPEKSLDILNHMIKNNNI